MRYEVDFTAHAKRELRKLPKHVQMLLQPVIDELAHDPRPHGYRKLSGFKSIYRVRVGDYRVIYQIEDNILLVLIVGVGDRAEIYRKFQIP